jgi:hypothetical protein
MSKILALFGSAVAIGLLGGLVAWSLAHRATAPQPVAPQEWQTYESSARAFSLRYPPGYTVDAGYVYQNLGPGKEIKGVKFTIDPALATSTNLASDSYVSVEEIPQANSPTGTCTADKFLDLANGTAAQALSDHGTTYSFASSTGAAAGNRYEEWIYTIPGANFCVAVRYFIHYGVLENYSAGTVHAFDRAALLAQFDAIRRSLVLQ